MAGDTSIFGLMGFTHGWARMLTVMSPVGATELARLLGQPDGVVARTRNGDLLRFQEQSAGALGRLIESHGIILLEKPEWNAKKAELGDAAFLPMK